MTSPPTELLPITGDSPFAKGVGAYVFHLGADEGIETLEQGQQRLAESTIVGALSVFFRTSSRPGGVDISHKLMLEPEASVDQPEPLASPDAYQALRVEQLRHDGSSESGTLRTYARREALPRISQLIANGNWNRLGGSVDFIAPGSKEISTALFFSRQVALELGSDARNVIQERRTYPYSVVSSASLLKEVELLSSDGQNLKPEIESRLGFYLVARNLPDVTQLRHRQRPMPIVTRTAMPMPATYEVREAVAVAL